MSTKCQIPNTQCRPLRSDVDSGNPFCFVQLLSLFFPAAIPFNRALYPVSTVVQLAAPLPLPGHQGTRGGPPATLVHSILPDWVGTKVCVLGGSSWWYLPCDGGELGGKVDLLILSLGTVVRLSSQHGGGDRGSRRGKGKVTKKKKNRKKKRNERADGDLTRTTSNWHSMGM